MQVVSDVLVTEGRLPQRRGDRPPCRLVAVQQQQVVKQMHVPHPLPWPPVNNPGDDVDGLVPQREQVLASHVVATPLPAGRCESGGPAPRPPRLAAPPGGALAP